MRIKVTATVSYLFLYFFTFIGGYKDNQKVLSGKYTSRYHLAVLKLSEKIETADFSIRSKHCGHELI